jgi:glycosyltransferase involved in cell wall biosynthesis
MLVGWKITQDEEVGPVSNRAGLQLLDRMCNRITKRLALPDLFFPSSFLISRHPWFRKANILQFYNMHGGYFGHTALPSITRRRPVIWRLSDMWPMTGHCGYAYECEAWKTACGSCPRLEEIPSLIRDTTRLLWYLKKRIYGNSRFIIVAPSKWIAELAKQSPLLGRFPVHLIPNGVDTVVFRRMPKKAARSILNLPTTHRIVLFSAQGLDDPRKGGPLLKSALEQLANKKIGQITVLLAGRSRHQDDVGDHFPTKYVGHLVNNDLMMAVLYSAADIFVLPTLADNFPNAMLESMACGTPVISFFVGGIPEAVRHMVTGYLAAPNDSQDLAKGIEILLDNSTRSKMSHRCREVVEKEYLQEIEVRRYSELYNEILERS